MNPPLTHVELRVLGSLIEKAATVPDSYPLTLSGLVAACNQLTNREPVMQLDEDTVISAIVTLRRRSLVRAIQPAGSRVTKYLHLLDEALDLDARELALLAVLMLRGPQTSAELHTRTARLADFESGVSLDQVLEALLARDSGSLVVRLARQPGQKEVRYAQLLGGPVTEVAAPAAQERAAPAATAERQALEARVQTLEQEIAALRADFAAFKAQFS
ncbi:MAG: YceH family protein [Gemmatimonadaceae bacterium]|nr:YceH family protein [Gemmatimonadaceae bacterium]